MMARERPSSRETPPEAARATRPLSVSALRLPCGSSEGSAFFTAADVVRSGSRVRSIGGQPGRDAAQVVARHAHQDLGGHQLQGLLHHVERLQQRDEDVVFVLAGAQERVSHAATEFGYHGRLPSVPGQAKSSKAVDSQAGNANFLAAG